MLRRPLESAQYTSQEFRQLLEKHHITQSLSRPAKCWDNSVAESWFGTYKLEMVEGRSWRSIAELRAETLLWIEGWYNLRRRHPSLKYLSPVQYERQLSANQPLPKRPNQNVRRTGAIPLSAWNTRCRCLMSVGLTSGLQKVAAVVAHCKGSRRGAPPGVWSRAAGHSLVLRRGGPGCLSRRAPGRSLSCAVVPARAAA